MTVFLSIKVYIFAVFNTVVSVSLGPPTRYIIIYNYNQYSHIAEVTAATVTDVNLILKERTHMRLYLNMLYANA